MTKKAEITKVERGTYGMTELQCNAFRQTSAAIGQALSEYHNYRSQVFVVRDHCKLSAQLGRYLPDDEESVFLSKMHRQHGITNASQSYDSADSAFLNKYRQYRAVDWTDVDRYQGWSHMVPKLRAAA